jgi:C-terminal processing protease CtpA/Prc
VANGQGGTALKVLGLVLGSPAQSAGVRQGDELLSVDGSSVTGKTAFEAASLIQGPKGTPVSIEVSPFLSVIKALCILLVQVQCHVDTLHIVFLSHMLLCVSIL